MTKANAEAFVEGDPLRSPSRRAVSHKLFNYSTTDATPNKLKFELTKTFIITALVLVFPAAFASELNAAAAPITQLASPSDSSLGDLISFGLDVHGNGSYAYYKPPFKWTVVFKDSKGNVKRKWSAPGYAAHSPNGDTVLLVKLKEGDKQRPQRQDLEVLSADGQSLWESKDVICCGLFSVSDSGRALQFPYRGGSQFTYFDANGAPHPLPSNSHFLDDGNKVNWSPNGHVATISAGDRRSLIHIRSDGTIAFEKSFSKGERVVKHIPLDDETTIVISKSPRKDSKSATILVFDKNGAEKTTAPVDAGETISSLQASPDQAALSIVTHANHAVKILDRTTLQTLYQHSSTTTIITHTSFVEDSTNLLVGESDVRPHRIMGEARATETEGDVQFFIHERNNNLKRKLQFRANKRATVRYDRRSNRLLLQDAGFLRSLPTR